MSEHWQPPSGWEKRPVVVLGGGVLGRRIAACFSAGGWPVRIRDPSGPQRDASVKFIKDNIGEFTALTRRDAGTHVEAVEDLASALKDTWLVFEAVPEKLEIKLSTFADLERLAPTDCILASNSSSFKSSELVLRMSEAGKKRVLNTHFMMPPEALIVELMTDGHTYPEIFPFVTERLKEAGLHPIVALRESTGFVFNRIWAAIKRETIKVLQEGVSTPSEIDRVFKENYGARIGPCRMMDQVGLDSVENIEEHYITERGLARDHLDWLHTNYIATGKLGNKAQGKGGLYPIPKPGTQTKILLLNIGLAEPAGAKDSLSDIMQRGQVLSVDVDTARATEILGHGRMLDGIDVDKSTHRMIWTAMGTPKLNDAEVYSANLDGSDVKIIVPTGAIHTAKQCVIDQDAQKVYVCDREGLRVMRVGIDGSHLETLVQTGDWRNPSHMADQTKWCVGIAVSRKLGRFFWTQKGASKASQGRIFSARIDMPDGATPCNRPDVEVVASDLPEPIDLEMDDERGILYWTDRGELPLGNTLNCKHLIGDIPSSERAMGRQILAQAFGEAIGLRLDKENGVVWVADMSGRLWKCDAHRPSNKIKVYEDEKSAFTGLAILHI